MGNHPDAPGALQRAPSASGCLPTLFPQYATTTSTPTHAGLSVYGVGTCVWSISM